MRSRKETIMSNTVNQQTHDTNREERTNSNPTNHKTTNKTTGINKYLTIIILNMNGIDSPIKRHNTD